MTSVFPSRVGMGRETYTDEFSLGHTEFGVSVILPGENIKQAGNNDKHEGWKRALSQRDGFWHHQPERRI